MPEIRFDAKPDTVAVIDGFCSATGKCRTTFICLCQQLVDAIGIPLNAVCGRVNSLLAKKALCVRGFHVDPTTRKRQELVGLPVAEQGALFT